MNSEQRLTEWATFAGEFLVNCYADSGTLYRMMREGACSGSGSTNNNGPVPLLVDRQNALLSVEKRCQEMATLIKAMPDDWITVIRLEWLEGKGYRRAKAEQGWPERKWVATRARMLGWLDARLPNPHRG